MRWLLVSCAITAGLTFARSQHLIDPSQKDASSLTANDPIGAQLSWPSRPDTYFSIPGLTGTSTFWVPSAVHSEARLG